MYKQIELENIGNKVWEYIINSMKTHRKNVKKLENKWFFFYFVASFQRPEVFECELGPVSQDTIVRGIKKGDPQA